MIVYFESSALIKLFLSEPDSQIALDIWNDADQIITSEISYLEVYAGLARAMRENPPKLSKTGYGDAKVQFEQVWGQIFSVSVTSALIRDASDAAEKYSLRAYDALQFATALAVADDGISLATTDKGLYATKRG